MKNKIGWCDMTWNPVWGCRNHCKYCYARGIAKRFRRKMGELEYRNCGPDVKGGISLIETKLKYFLPTFLNSQFDKKFPKKPQRIFVGSMSEIYYWEKEWMNKAIFKIFEYPQHIFQFLTKYPEAYCKWDFPENCWLGITMTKNSDLDLHEDEFDYYEKYFDLNCIKFLSLEPILEEITILDFIYCFDWVIIGAETGNRKGKVIPKWEWINDIVLYCKDKYIPIYLKDSLKEIYPIEIKEFPYLKGVRTNV